MNRDLPFCLASVVVYHCWVRQVPVRLFKNFSDIFPNEVIDVVKTASFGLADSKLYCPLQSFVNKAGCVK
jgi:hypothetical protein